MSAIVKVSRISPCPAARATSFVPGDAHEPRRSQQSRQRHGRAGPRNSCRGRILRHDQEALRCDRRRIDRGQPPRLSRAAVPLEGRDVEEHLRRDPLRRDDLAEGEGRHAAGQADRAGRLHSRHQGRRRHAAAAGLPERTDHRRPRQARRAPEEILRPGCALCEVARGDRHRRRAFRATLRSTPTRMRSRATRRSARRRRSCRSSSRKC